MPAHAHTGSGPILVVSVSPMPGITLFPIYPGADVVGYVGGMVEYRGTVCTDLKRGADCIVAGPGPPEVRVGT